MVDIATCSSKGLQRVRDYGFLRSNIRTLRRKIQLLFIPSLASSLPESSVSRNKAFRLSLAASMKYHALRSVERVSRKAKI